MSRERQEINHRDFENYLIDKGLVGRSVEHRLYETIGAMVARPLFSTKLELGDVPLRYANKYLDQPEEGKIGRKRISQRSLPYSVTVGRLLPPFADDAREDKWFEGDTQVTDFVAFSMIKPELDASVSGLIYVSPVSALAEVEIYLPEHDRMDHEMYAFTSRLGLGALARYVNNRYEPGTSVVGTIDMFPQMKEILAGNLEDLIDPPQ